MPELPTFTATRYVQPLREGGSLPAVVETHDGGLFVVKFRGAGQGAKALVAELIVGLLACDLALPVPRLALIDVPAPFGRSEPDPEIQDILKGSHGLNVGLQYLDGAFNFDVSAAGELVSPELAARVVWLDALVTNPDRTHRNPNVLIWEARPWLIDHGAALYAHHAWSSVDDARIRTPFPLTEKHVLLARSGDIAAADDSMSRVLTGDLIAHVLDLVPDTLLAGGDFTDAAAARERYVHYLRTRLAPPRAFVAEAVGARERIARAPGPAARVSARR